MCSGVLQKMLRRALDFLTQHVGLLPKDSAADVILAELGQTVDTLAGHSSSQLAGYDAIRTSNGARVAAREALPARPVLAASA